ncbi:MAG: NAD-binding protein, partial [Clostridiaceae bacterium]|nr:NAD-binding protein [Clostridiaceae bacterium]
MKIIVGAGAAGMMAAGTAASLGKDVILIEKNDELGKKLKITGKGRCNLTCACDKDEFFKNIPTNPSFLYSAFSQFSNYDTISFFENLGVKTKVERGMRVFPESDKAKDVVDALKKYVFSNNAKVIKGEVKQLLFDDGKVIGVKLSGGEKIYGDG